MNEREEEFEAQKVIVENISSMSHAKATRVLSIVAIYFVYFQIILNDGVRKLITSITFPITFPEFFPKSLPFIGIPQIHKVVFGVITVIFIWQLISLRWYSHFEQQIFNLQYYEIYKLRNSKYRHYDVIARIYRFIGDKARERMIWKITYYLTGFSVYSKETVGKAILVFLFYWGFIFYCCNIIGHNFIP